MPREWDAATYDRIAHPMTRWGSSVVARLQLRGNETVLDAGCGSGRVTEPLLGRLPEGHVVALDGSAAMLAEARRRLAPHRHALTFVHADLQQPLELPRPIDAVYSAATFHWVRDHAALFRNLAAALPPGGQLVAQYGGGANIASVLGILADLGVTDLPWCFATPEEDRARLEAAGFAVDDIWLNEEQVELGPGEPIETYLATVVLGWHLDRLPASERQPFVAEVGRRLPGGTLDYVRLNVIAHRRRSAQQNE
jgi:trans-aconitate 2-methyltransferase